MVKHYHVKSKRVCHSNRVLLLSGPWKPEVSRCPRARMAQLGPRAETPRAQATPPSLPAGHTAVSVTQAAATPPRSPPESREPGSAHPLRPGSQRGGRNYPAPASFVLPRTENHVSAPRAQDNTLLPRRPGDEHSAWASRTERALTWFCLIGTKLQCEEMESSGDGKWCWLHNSLNGLKATEPDT